MAVDEVNVGEVAVAVVTGIQIGKAANSVFANSVYRIISVLGKRAKSIISRLLYTINIQLAAISHIGLRCIKSNDRVKPRGWISEQRNGISAVYSTGIRVKNNNKFIVSSQFNTSPLRTNRDSAN